MLERYRDFAPTPFDIAGAFLHDERQTWLVAPVSRTRDSGPLAESNFETLESELDELDPECLYHETHRFGHWGPGWFEIILVRPLSLCHAIAEQAHGALENYPILDEEDLSRREFEEACDAWGWLPINERFEICKQHGVSVFAARRDEIPQGLPYWDDFYSPAD